MDYTSVAKMTVVLISKADLNYLYSYKETFFDSNVLKRQNKYTGNPFPICVPISTFLYKCDMP